MLHERSVSGSKRIINGKLQIPEGPGLGVDLNWSEFDRHPYQITNFLPRFAPGWEYREGESYRWNLDVFDGRPLNTLRSKFSTEERYVTTAIVNERFMTVIWTPRGNRIRLISARRSHDPEKRAYHENNRF